MFASPRRVSRCVRRILARSVRPGLTLALSMLLALSAGCATARRLVSPAPPMAPEIVASRTGWVKKTDSLQDLRFTPDASISTPAGEVFGGLAAESFANGTLEGAGYTGVALTIGSEYICDDQVVIVAGDYQAMATDSGVAYPVHGPFLIRAIVDAQGSAHANMVRLSTTRGVRVGALAGGCHEPAAYDFANRSRGIAVFGTGYFSTTEQSHAVAEMKYANWFCPVSSGCPKRPRAQSVGIFAEAYERLGQNYGVQLLAGRLRGTTTRGYRVINGMSLGNGSGPVNLRNTVDALAATLYVERQDVRLAAGPALIRSSWGFDANIYGADNLSFNGAHTSALKPALVGSATLMLRFGSRIDVELTAVGDLAGPVTPPAVLEFQPDPINASGIDFAVGLGIRP